jgi:hypothetical protein
MRLEAYRGARLEQIFHNTMEALLETFLTTYKIMEIIRVAIVTVAFCTSNSTGRAKNDNLLQKDDNANSSLRQKKKVMIDSD